MADKWVYLGCCYTVEKTYPFGFCRKCWIKNGKPRAVGDDNGDKCE